MGKLFASAALAPRRFAVHLASAAPVRLRFAVDAGGGVSGVTISAGTTNAIGKRIAQEQS